MMDFLAFSNGVRPHVIGRMKKHEFDKGKIVDGVFLVTVADHKRGNKGAALMGFFTPLLRESVQRYINIFKPDMRASDFVFATERGGDYYIN